MGLAERSAKRARLSPLKPQVPPGNAVKGKDVAGEDAFMAELLAGIDASVFDAPPSSQGSRATPRLTPSRKENGPVRRAPVTDSSPPKPTPRSKPAPMPRPKPYARPPLSGLGKRKDDSLETVLGLKPKVKAEREALASLATNIEARTRRVDTMFKPHVKAEPKVETKVELKPAAVLPPIPSLPERKPLAPLQSTTSLAVQPPTSPRTLPDLVECLPGSQEDYDGDWDLDALAGLDDKVFDEPTVRALALIDTDAQTYPIANPAVPPPPAGYRPTPWVRCTVESVHGGILADLPEDEYDEGVGWGKSLVVNTPGGRRVVQLKERWADLRLRPNDIVNVVSPFVDGTGPIAITFKDTSSYLIAHPDILVTMTAIANAMPCPRRPLLNQLVRLPEPLSKPIIYGNILHGLLQESLSERSFDAASTRRRVGTDLAKDERRLEVWGAGLDPGAVANDLGRNAEDAFASFGRRWIGSEPKVGFIMARI